MLIRKMKETLTHNVLQVALVATLTDKIDYNY